MGDDETQNAIAKEFETLIGVGARGRTADMRQCMDQQPLIDEAVAKPRLQCGEVVNLGHAVNAPA